MFVCIYEMKQLTLDVIINLRILITSECTVYVSIKVLVSSSSPPCSIQLCGLFLSRDKEKHLASTLIVTWPLSLSSPTITARVPTYSGNTTVKRLQIFQQEFHRSEEIQMLLRRIQGWGVGWFPTRFLCSDQIDPFKIFLKGGTMINMIFFFPQHGICLSFSNGNEKLFQNSHLCIYIIKVMFMILWTESNQVKLRH